MKTRLLAAAMVAVTLGVALPAAEAVTLVVREAPPAVRVETVPAPRPGYQWVGGHWDWRGSKYVWERHLGEGTPRLCVLRADLGREERPLGAPRGPLGAS